MLSAEREKEIREYFKPAWDQHIVEAGFVKELFAEIDRLKRIILKELTENDDLGCEYAYVLALKEEVSRLREIEKSTVHKINKKVSSRAADRNSELKHKLLSAEREKEIREWVNDSECYCSYEGICERCTFLSDVGAKELLTEVDRLRDDWKAENEALNVLRSVHKLEKQKRDIAVKALEEVLENGKRAHQDGTPDSHSFYLGLSVGLASKTLKQIRVENEIKNN